MCWAVNVWATSRLPLPGVRVLPVGSMQLASGSAAAPAGETSHPASADTVTVAIVIFRNRPRTLSSAVERTRI